MIMKKMEHYFKAVISGKKRGLTPWLIKSILLPFSWIYGSFSRCRNWFYDEGWMKCYIPPVPLVISVGNIVAGGTGKTPVTLMLIQAFYEKYSMAILSRGYRSKAENLDSPVILCEGQGPLFPSSYCGDEPHIYALRYPKLHVIVGSNRKKASRMASKAGVQVIILDDALQHRKLARDFDIIVIDLNDPFGQNHFLPRGYLREDVKALKRAHCIILNHVQSQEQFKKMENEIKQYSLAPIIGTRYQVTCIRDLGGNELPSLQRSTVGMFCSIAHPAYFKRLLEDEGALVAAEYSLADHDEIKEKDLIYFTQQCIKKGCQLLVCTEKDRVKLRDQLSLDLPIAWIQIEMKIVEGQEEWQKFLNYTISKIN